VKLKKKDPSGRDVLEAGSAGVERELARLVPAAAPAGLRQRVLGRAAEARRSSLLSPSWRAAAAVCSAVIAAVLLIDPVVGRFEAARLEALLDGRPPAATTSESPGELTEVLTGQGQEADRLNRLQTLAAASARMAAEREFFEAQRWLKGWLGDETLENPD
jgi:hypothetical protein